MKMDPILADEMDARKIGASIPESATMVSRYEARLTVADGVYTNRVYIHRLEDGEFMVTNQFRDKDDNPVRVEGNFSIFTPSRKRAQTHFELMLSSTEVTARQTNTPIVKSCHENIN